MTQNESFFYDKLIALKLILKIPGIEAAE